MIGYRFSEFIAKEKPLFDQLLELFLEMLVYTNGDVDEAIEWLRQIDEEHQITTDDYTIDDFIKELEEKTIVRKMSGGEGLGLTGKGERFIRQQSLNQIFGQLKGGASGNHNSSKQGKGDESLGNQRAFEFGDALHQVDFTQSFQNAMKRNGFDQFKISEEDLVVEEREQKTQMSTVLMIDISHSMILYGEDRITPAKKVAMALAELITTRYPKDKLDVIVFGNDAWQVSISELPYLQVGPFHTNTIAGLELAMDLLRKQKNTHRQIFMITDGKPTCIKNKDGSYYKNPGYLDHTITNKTIDLAVRCRRLQIPITTFMVTQDPYLQEFVEEFTQANQGKAFYSGLDGLGSFIFKDYEQNRRKKLR